LRIFYDKRISEEVAADALGDDFKGYVLKITGGHDKQGFGMLQGVLLNHRTRLLLDGTTGQYRPKKDGARKRKSVRGCIVGADLSCLNLVIVKRGPADIAKLTDKASDRPSTRGPKRANHIRRVWGLTKEEDVRKYVVRRVVPGKNGKKDHSKAPKIQRLITPVVRLRKKQRLAEKKERYVKASTAAVEYQKLLIQRRQSARAELLSKKREKKSVKVDAKDVKKAPVKTDAKKVETKPAAKTVAAKTVVAKTVAAKPTQTKTDAKPAAKTTGKPATTGKPTTKPAAKKGPSTKK
jgi:small subunit ribosomal protein S6e